MSKTTKQVLILMGIITALDSAIIGVLLQFGRLDIIALVIVFTWLLFFLLVSAACLVIIGEWLNKN